MMLDVIAAYTVLAFAFGLFAFFFARRYCQSKRLYEAGAMSRPVFAILGGSCLIIAILTGIIAAFCVVITFGAIRYF